jgi:hypothetical protein
MTLILNKPDLSLANGLDKPTVLVYLNQFVFGAAIG